MRDEARAGRAGVGLQVTAVWACHHLQAWLVGALLVGVARPGLARGEKPLIGILSLEGVSANFSSNTIRTWSLVYRRLIVSGGHSVVCVDYQQFEILEPHQGTTPAEHLTRWPVRVGLGYPAAPKVGRDGGRNPTSIESFPGKVDSSPYN